MSFLKSARYLKNKDIDGLKSLSSELPMSVQDTVLFTEQVIEYAHRKKIDYREATYDLFSLKREDFLDKYTPAKIIEMQKHYLKIATALNRVFEK